MKKQKNQNTRERKNSRTMPFNIGTLNHWHLPDLWFLPYGVFPKRWY